jgi:hypothetical protein
MQTNTVSSTATKLPSLTPEQIPAEALKESVAQVMSELTGKTVSAGAASDLKLSEDVLYASVVHQRLEARYPGTGKKLLDAVGDEYGLNVKNQRRQPLKIAVDHYLHSMVRDRQITNNSKEALMRYAFGKSQLDNSRSTLARAPENTTNSLPIPTGKSALDLTFERISQNKGASKKELQIFSERLAKNRTLTDAQAKEQADVLTRMFPSKKVEAPTVTTGTPPKVQGSSETDKPGEIPDPKKLTSGPNDFVYKPASELDNKLVFILPQRYRERAVAANIFALDSERKIASLQAPRYGDDSRPYFRGDTAGSTLSGAATLRVELVDGSMVNFEIPDLKQGHLVSY